MDVTVWLCDEQACPTSVKTWSSTFMSLEAGYLIQGDEIDFSDPDKGIFFRRAYISYVENEEGQAFSMMPADQEDICVFGPETMSRALVVQVNGVTVLERAKQDTTPDFKCGLMRTQQNGTDIEMQEEVSQQNPSSDDAFCEQDF